MIQEKEMNFERRYNAMNDGRSSKFLQIFLSYTVIKFLMVSLFYIMVYFCDDIIYSGYDFTLNHAKLLGDSGVELDTVFNSLFENMAKREFFAEIENSNYCKKNFFDFF